ncbi:MAG: pyruvate dehydrogenase (acetyl-transferring) E1 component subunit alpha, partial [Pedobacter sp.]
AWITEIEEKVKGIVDESVKFAEESPWPQPEELFDDIYIQSDYPFQEV